MLRARINAYKHEHFHLRLVISYLRTSDDNLDLKIGPELFRDFRIIYGGSRARSCGSLAIIQTYEGDRSIAVSKRRLYFAIRYISKEHISLRYRSSESTKPPSIARARARAHVPDASSPCNTRKKRAVRAHGTKRKRREPRAKVPRAVHRSR